MGIDLNRLRSVCTDAVLQRGKQYFLEGRVQILANTEQGITAKVSGGSDYTVGVDLRDQVNAGCNCPYRGEGFCKHIVAVFIAILVRAEQEKRDRLVREAREQVQVPPPENDRHMVAFPAGAPAGEPEPAARMRLSDLIRMIGESDPEVLRNFLQREVRENPLFASRLLGYLRRKSA